MVVRDNPASPWRCLSDNYPPTSEIIDVENSSQPPTAGTKRPLSPSNAHVPEAKRVRGISTTPVSGVCLAPESNSIAQAIFENLTAPAEHSLGMGDLFLSENFRERWCHCARVSFNPLSFRYVSSFRSVYHH
jgi:E3 ubiquitin-protein ligase UBR7